MINNLIHAQNYTQNATIQHQSNEVRPISKANGTPIENSFAAIVTLTESGKAAAAKLDSPDSISNPSSNHVMLTDKGNIKVDLDSYFSNNPGSTGILNANDYDVTNISQNEMAIMVSSLTDNKLISSTDSLYLMAPRSMNLDPDVKFDLLATSRKALAFAKEQGTSAEDIKNRERVVDILETLQKLFPKT